MGSKHSVANFLSTVRESRLVGKGHLRQGRTKSWGTVVESRISVQAIFSSVCCFFPQWNANAVFMQSPSLRDRHFVHLHFFSTSVEIRSPPPPMTSEQVNESFQTAILQWLTITRPQPHSLPLFSQTTFLYLHVNHNSLASGGLKARYHCLLLFWLVWLKSTSDLFMAGGWGATGGY